MERENNINLYQSLADQLDKIIEGQSGKDYVKWIIDDLKKGDIDSAKANYKNQSDKFDSLPEIKNLLKEAGLVEEIDWSKFANDEE